MIESISSGAALRDPPDGRGSQPPGIGKSLAISFRGKVLRGKQVPPVQPRMNLL